jgi:phosphohistidine phosphatase
MMNLFLIQHGDAIPEEVDPDRPLSEQGRQDIRRLAEFLQDRGIRVLRILHSGKTRARQTADLLATAIASEDAVISAPGLRPKDPVESVSLKLAEYTEDLLVVSHMPLLGKLTAYLVTEREDRDIVRFRPGTLVCLERGKEKGWVITWMVHPEVL